ncbi:MAG: AbrB/MazE/SpoVT family DNA-binding domain-containing protein [Alphaproteobacteria bacterium]|nr:AbrB/MazE/SpoVT family DNA-binding domain-containing protein [Alphaproteobacteria bacterium]
MKSRIGLWGGSCAVRLPKMAVETLGLHEGETIEIRIENDALVIRRDRPSYALEDLVAEAQEATPPPSLDDAPQGEEAF